MNAIKDTFVQDPGPALYADELNDALGAAILARNGIYGAFMREMALR